MSLNFLSVKGWRYTSQLFYFCSGKDTKPWIKACFPSTYLISAVTVQGIDQGYTYLRFEKYQLVYGYESFEKDYAYNQQITVCTICHYQHNNKSVL